MQFPVRNLPPVWTTHWYLTMESLVSEVRAELEAWAGAGPPSSAPPGRWRGKPALCGGTRPRRRGYSWGQRSEGGFLCARGPPEPWRGVRSKQEDADETKRNLWTWQARNRGTRRQNNNKKIEKFNKWQEMMTQTNSTVLQTQWLWYNKNTNNSYFKYQWSFVLLIHLWGIFLYIDSFSSTSNVIKFQKRKI